MNPSLKKKVCVQCLWNDATHTDGAGQTLCDECDPHPDDDELDDEEE